MSLEQYVQYRKDVAAVARTLTSMKAMSKASFDLNRLHRATRVIMRDYNYTPWWAFWRTPEHVVKTVWCNGAGNVVLRVPGTMRFTQVID